jgi:hypothetical protein
MKSKARMLVSLSLGLVLAICAAPSLSAQACTVPGTVEVSGSGSPGTAGVPVLTAVGLPIAGAPGFGLQLTQGNNFATGFILVGPTYNPQTMNQFGATLYLQYPFHHFRVWNDANGTSFLPMPQVETFAAEFCGLTLHAQAVIVDPAAQGGIAFSNALSITFGS